MKTVFGSWICLRDLWKEQNTRKKLGENLDCEISFFILSVFPLLIHKIQTQHYRGEMWNLQN